MKISKTEEYGMRLAMSLADDGAQISVGEISRREGIPEPTVAKLLMRLRRGGIVRAERGRNGGYRLGRAPDEISVADVLGALDEPLLAGRVCVDHAPPTLSSDEPDCPHVQDCGMRPVWRHLAELVGEVLARTTLHDLLGGTGRMSEHLRDLGLAGDRDEAVVVTTTTR